jgi:hypothetical protein
MSFFIRAIAVGSAAAAVATLLFGRGFIFRGAAAATPNSSGSSGIIAIAAEATDATDSSIGTFSLSFSGFSMITYTYTDTDSSAILYITLRNKKD